MAVLLSSYVLGLILFALMSRSIGLFTYQSFTFAPGLFISMPLSMLGFALTFDGKTVNYGDFSLNPVTYAFLILFNLVSILLSFWAMAFAYKWRMSRPVKAYYYVDTRSFGFTLVMFGFLALTLALFLYLHASFHFAYILDPRRLYEITRQGYGHFYFVMAICMKLAFVMCLFSRYNNPPMLFLLFLLALATGSKTHAFILFLIFVGHRIVFVYRNRIPAAFVGVLAAFALFLIGGLFAMSFRVGGGISLKTLGLLITGFMNEGNNNTVLILDTYHSTFRESFLGSIFLENNLLTRIPRVLFPDKPVIFGSFRLADAYFYEHTALGVGAKTFGTIGDFFADFGYAAFGIIILNALVFYALAGIFLAKLTRLERPDHGFLHFAMLLLFCNVYFVAVPPGNNLPENILVILGIGAIAGFHKVTLAPRPTEEPQG